MPCTTIGRQIVVARYRKWASAERMRSRSIERPVLLVTLAVFINYIDRGNLATAAPLIQDQLGLTATQLGVLGSAFYYTYVPLMPAAGWFAEHLGAGEPLLRDTSSSADFDRRHFWSGGPNTWWRARQAP